MGSKQKRKKKGKKTKWRTKNLDIRQKLKIVANIIKYIKKSDNVK